MPGPMVLEITAERMIGALGGGGLGLDDGVHQRA